MTTFKVTFENGKTEVVREAVRVDFDESKGVITLYGKDDKVVAKYTRAIGYQQHDDDLDFGIA